MPYAIDLFCGAGGMSEGIIQAGFHILFSSDINESVQVTYKHRHEQLGYIHGRNTFYLREDIRNLTGKIIRESISSLDIFAGKECPEIDAIFGGPPCQGFSHAGKRDPNDPRNMLFREYVRVISEIEPKYVVLENVLGFKDMILYDFEGHSGVTYEGGHTVPDLLRAELDHFGYCMDIESLDASDFGVPQRRERVIVFAYRKGLTEPEYPKPLSSPKVTVSDAISDLIIDDSIRKQKSSKPTQYQLDSINGRTPNVDGRTIPCSTITHNHEIPSHQKLTCERFSLYKEGESTTDLRRRILSHGINLEDCPELVALCSKKLSISNQEVIDKFKKPSVSESNVDVLLTKKNIRVRMSSDKPSATVVTIPDDYIVPFEPRTFSVRELARLQSFDDSFEFLGKRSTGGLKRRIEVPQYSQVGNAVPPLLAKAIALQIKKALETGDSDA